MFISTDLNNRRYWRYSSDVYKLWYVLNVFKLQYLSDVFLKYLSDVFVFCKDMCRIYLFRQILMTEDIPRTDINFDICWMCLNFGICRMYWLNIYRMCLWCSLWACHCVAPVLQTQKNTQCAIMLLWYSFQWLFLCSLFNLWSNEGDTDCMRVRDV